MRFCPTPRRGTPSCDQAETASPPPQRGRTAKRASGEPGGDFKAVEWGCGGAFFCGVRQMALKPLKNLERAKGFEPSTPTLARLCSTPELRPLWRFRKHCFRMESGAVSIGSGCRQEGMWVSAPYGPLHRKFCRFALHKSRKSATLDPVNPTIKQSANQPARSKHLGKPRPKYRRTKGG